MKQESLVIVFRAASEKEMRNRPVVEKSLYDIRKLYLKMVWINARMLTELAKNR